MKCIGWLYGILLLLSLEAFGQRQELYVKVNKENLRATPNGKRQGELLAGTKVKILERQTNWVKVQFTGWIWEKSLTSDLTLVQGFMVSASHILVETEAESKQILEQLKQGAAFEEMARQFSIDRASGLRGGDLGKFGRGDFRPEFEDAVFNMKEGEVSGIIQTELGFHIIKRTG